MAALLTILGGVSGLYWYITKTTIKSALLESRQELIKEINGTYVRSVVCEEKMKSLRCMVEHCPMHSSYSGD